MKNLKNYNVQEMNSTEVKKINGGWLFVPAYISYAIAAYYETKNAIVDTISDAINPNK